MQTKRTLHDFETTIETKTGEHRVVMLSAEVVNMANKPNIISVVRDITEHKKAEKALRQKDRDIRKAYVDVLSAVTNGKLLILTENEISAAQGEPLDEPYTISSFAQLGEFRNSLEKTLESCDIDRDRLNDLLLEIGRASCRERV